METLIALIPALPLLSFLTIALFGSLMPKKVVAVSGAGSVAVSAILTIIAGIGLITSEPDGGVFTISLYNWINTGGLTVPISFVLDPLSFVFCFVITFVGALIHLYSVGFMSEDEGFARFFAYMNLFVGSMLILVLAGNLLLLYLGWEGVGLCSYLLIGFWYKDPVNGYAARKAFIVTRIGDTAMILGMFLLFVSLGTLDIDQLTQKASAEWITGSPVAVISALLLLGGAVGKSAQLPLQTWLPDAMAGPSPVSALIHAATMVTAGVYLVTRLHVLFVLSPFVMGIIAIVGAVTLLIAGFSALAQSDLKRVLAYSTISQIGYMFLAMGIGAWSAAIFHFMIHAFFKALLFLSGGIVIQLLHHEHDMFRMGGLRKRMPLIYYTFLTGAASLSALPLITAGFYSKDQILWFGWSSAASSQWLWLAGISGALITSLYAFRMVFITFFGEVRTEPHGKPGISMVFPLIVLAILSITGGLVEMPENIGPVHLFSNLFGSSLPEARIGVRGGHEFFFQLLSASITIGGVVLAYWLFYRKPALENRIRESPLSRYFLSGWKFDRLYDFLLVKPVVWLSEIDRKDFVDLAYNSIATATSWINSLISLSQNGKLRWYVLFLTAGIVVMLTLMISL